ncbi:efflux RND transporter periplasmic adaptor subunit [Marinobacterium sediminicola]|uniref:Membrane fusion protein, Cu(I)/Ag(I) efflux system n=1 Tax=Marinobacterium sediminicola TaxID=518898 RepID=A0ABY1S293_9GAMM|nr:efflux RND transporter periplasmic adaptor subunit [Marinobacterium sediminicola]ULG68485.1 efflux RND transporter periplasmic adaptor subunit [Marinobacterium sediminicola]SMR76733.1 membrane fusion protein, Cu(I)/Ag(I) efflux system [Marinobacterium sediminicola]
MSGTVKFLGALVLGSVVGGGAVYVLNQGASSEAGKTSVASSEPEPLYWVAPMDPNYRRDKPGKSPMGMDLIPVYEEDAASGADEGPGTIRISPEVVNNLGVRTASVEHSALSFEVSTVGYVQYDQDRIVHLHPRVEGWVERIHVQAAGEPVEQGQPLYELYSPALVNAQEEMLFALGRGDTRLAQAAESRLRSLNVSDEVIQTLRRERKVSQTVTFYAPATGVVDDFTLREGLFVQPGMTLMSIGSLDEVWVEAEVFERQASLIRTGLPVSMELDYLPGREWQGSVDYIYPTLDPNTRTLRVRMRFDNSDHLLKPNMFAQVRIHNDTDIDVLSVPREAVIRGGDNNRVVLALGEGRFKSVHVKIGRSDGSRVEVLEGIREGEQVVTSAQFLLDSESSKTSDFSRMYYGDADDNSPTAMAGGSLTTPGRVWVDATVNAVMPEQGKINVSHAAIPDWGWPEMRMDFSVSEFVDMSELVPGAQGQIEVLKLDSGGYEVADVFLSNAETVSGDTQAEGSSPTGTPSRVWVDATVHEVMHQHGKINVSHAAIPAWGWPEMRMDFSVSEFVDMAELAPGAKGQIEVSKLDGGGYEVIDVFITEPGEGASASSAMESMDHSMHSMEQDVSGNGKEAK